MDTKGQPVLLELEYHHDCWCIECTSKREGSTISWLQHGYQYKDNTTGLFLLQSANPKEFTRQLRNHPWVREVVVLERGPTETLVTVRSKRNTLMAEAIAQAGCVPLEPAHTEAEMDHLSVIVPNDKMLPTLRSLLKERCASYRVVARKNLADIPKNIRPGPAMAEFLNFQSFATGLTQRQRDAFLLACEQGYYENPKQTSLEELAQKLGTHKATYAEHLRKVEAKLLPLVARTIGRLGSNPGQ